MQRRTKLLLIIGMMVVMGAVLAACTGATQVVAPTAVPSTPQPVPTCPAAPACPTAVPQPTAAPAEPVAPAVQAPFEAEWASSPHNNAEGAAFSYWNSSQDQMVPANCAKCHSTTGFIDFLGSDGTEANKVDNPHPIGTTVTCQACHDPAAVAKDTVVFPSGAVVTDLGSEARCMECHQGRASKVSVDSQIARFNAGDPLQADRAVQPITQGETVTRFGFINIHYYAAAATLYGAEVKGGYEYDGKAYDPKFDHVLGIDNCVACHDPHTTELRIELCAECHQGVASREDVRKIREVSSAPDYDGDGDVTEGIAEELEGMRGMLYAGILAYARDLQGTGIVYDSHSHPYFFNDRDNNGEPDTNEQGAKQAYNTWTPRLLKAAYNFQVASKDPGAYAHGNKYIIQLLYDSIEDLNASPMANKIDMSTMHRNDAGHFAGNTTAFRYWDETGVVPANCAKCHSATGLPEYIASGGTMAIALNGTVHTTGISAQPSVNGLQCSSCHDVQNFPAVYGRATVVFPSGVALSYNTEAGSDPLAANLCLECHQGRDSKVSVDRMLGNRPADTVDPAIRFRNIHYFAAGATLFGNEAKGIYQYDGKTYVDRWMHQGTLNKCTDCHDPHALEPNVASCAGCHQEAAGDLRNIRLTSREDYDGDGDTTEGLAGEIETLQQALYERLQAYATSTGNPIVYDSSAHPYFFLDRDGNGQPDRNEQGARIGYNAFTPRLLKAAYNYQYSRKDPGAYIHNFAYVAQALIDSIEDLGGDVSGYVRP